MSNDSNPNDPKERPILIENPHCQKCGESTTWQQLLATPLKLCSRCVLESTVALEQKPKEETSKVRSKFCYVGAPAIFALELACREVVDSFESYGCYLVGSCLERQNWRDVDVRMIMKDEDFFTLFPNAHDDGNWEFDSRWLLMTISISERLSKLTGLPIDFQFQPANFANKYHSGERHALGMRMMSKPDHSVNLNGDKK